MTDFQRCGRNKKIHVLHKNFINCDLNTIYPRAEISICLRSFSRFISSLERHVIEKEKMLWENEEEKNKIEIRSENIDRLYHIDWCIFPDEGRRKFEKRLQLAFRMLHNSQSLYVMIDCNVLELQTPTAVGLWECELSGCILLCKDGEFFMQLVFPELRMVGKCIDEMVLEDEERSYADSRKKMKVIIYVTAI